MRLGKKVLSVICVMMCSALISCGGSKELNSDLVSLISDTEVSEDGNYVIVVELKKGVNNVQYTLVENGNIISSEEDISEAILRENIIENKKDGEYTYTLNVKDENNNTVTKEVTVEVKIGEKQ